MISALCYFITYIFEAIISYMYFDQKYSKKVRNSFIFTGFSVSILFQFAVSFLDIPFINLAAFFFCNFALSFLLFNCSFLQSLFNDCILTATMFLTELCVFYGATTFFSINVLRYQIDDISLWIQASCAKLFYFFVAYLIAKLSTTESRKELGSTKASLLLLLPLVSIVLLLGIVRITIVVEVPKMIYFIFMLSTILLLLSNVLVFWVHESMIKTQKENTEFRLSKQKAEIDTEYYSLLQNQYENSNILIHDIKRHLLSVKELASHNDCGSILKYIDDLYDAYDIKYLKKYSNHKLINAIVNRYMTVCKEHKIDFYCDVRDIDFSFITDANLTSILDNLLENAVEASKDSNKKVIELSIKEFNSNFVAIHLENSCATAPKKSGGELKTTKNNKDIHGFGIRSIKRITKEYDGSINYSFDERTMTFMFTVVLCKNK